MKPFTVLIPVIAGLGGLAIATAAPAQDSVGVNAAIRNSVQTRSSAAAPLRPAQLRAPVRLGDQFVTGPQSQLQVLLRDRSAFTVGANTRMTVDRFVVSEGGAGGMTASVARGAFRFASGHTTRAPGRTAITTPVASIGVRGTIVEGIVGPEALDVLAQTPGVPAFGGDPETMLLVVLRGPAGDARSFDTPGEIDIEGQAGTITINEPGQAMLVTSEGLFGPFYLPDSVSEALAGLLMPVPNTAEDAGGEEAGEPVAIAADDSGGGGGEEGGAFAGAGSAADGIEPVMPPDADPADPDFPYYPPTGGNP